MRHDDDSIWVSIFRKSELIATSTAAGAMIGIAAGCSFFAEPRPTSMRLLPFWFLATTCAGTIIGLTIGIILESIVGAVRSDEKKKRRWE